jgi:hypothetical protein
MKNRTCILIAALLAAFTFTACEGPVGPAGDPGTQGLPGLDGSGPIRVKDATNQFIGYLVSTYTGVAGTYTVYNPSAIGALYPDGVFAIGKASYTGMLSAWTGSGTDGTTAVNLNYASNDGTGIPMVYTSSPSAYMVYYNYWNGVNANVLTYYTWKNDTNNDGLPDSVDATARNSYRSSENPSVLTQNSANTDNYYQLKTVTASEVDALKPLAYAKFLADTGLNPITWPLHLDVTE